MTAGLNPRVERHDWELFYQCDGNCMQKVTDNQTLRTLPDLSYIINAPPLCQRLPLAVSKMARSQ